MNEKQALEFCSRWLPAWTGNKPDLLIEFYSNEALYLDPANKAGLEGRDQILPYFRKLLSMNPNWKWEVLEVYPTEKGFLRKWKATIPVGTDVIIAHGIDIFEIKGGKIVRNEVYFDRTELLDALMRLKTKK